MKKTLTLMAVACAIGLCAPAWGVEVLSSNVVGYQKITLQAGYNLIANGFRIVGTENAPVLQDMFKDAEANAKGSTIQEESDNLQTWEGDRYATYWFYDATGTDDEDPAYDKKWYNVTDETTPTSDGMDTSEGAWYIAQSATTLTIAGQVGTNNVSVSLQNGYNLVANPFPADLTLNNPAIDWSKMGVVGSTIQEESDNLQTWKGDRYATYWFYDATGTDDEDPAYDKKWYNVTDETTPTSDTIPAGAGMWFIHRGSGATLSLPSPL